MSAEQKSVTLAFLLVAAGLAVKHSWLKKIGTWASAPPTVKAAELGPSGLAVTDLQAAIVLYVGLMLIADTQLAPVAGPLAWAIGLVEGFAAVGTLKTNYPQLFAGTAPSARPALQAGNTPAPLPGPGQVG